MNGLPNWYDYTESSMAVESLDFGREAQATTKSNHEANNSMRKRNFLREDNLS